MSAPPPTQKSAPHIPWGYGKNRVTGMPVDPENLYAYWEITNPARDAGRTALGEAGAQARLVLRIHDVTGIVFDGTNAHSHFDVPVEFSDRQWFTAVDRPGSSVTVEVGLLAPDGGYVPLARSGRVDFPRRGPVPPDEPAWGRAEAVTTGLSGKAELTLHVETAAMERSDPRRLTGGPPSEPSRAALSVDPDGSLAQPASSETRLEEERRGGRPGASEQRLRGRPA